MTETIDPDLPLATRVQWLLPNEPVNEEGYSLAPEIGEADLLEELDEVEEVPSVPSRKTAAQPLSRLSSIAPAPKLSPRPSRPKLKAPFTGSVNTAGLVADAYRHMERELGEFTHSNLGALEISSECQIEVARQTAEAIRKRAETLRKQELYQTVASLVQNVVYSVAIAINPLTAFEVLLLAFATGAETVNVLSASGVVDWAWERLLGEQDPMTKQILCEILPGIALIPIALVTAGRTRWDLDTLEHKHMKTIVALTETLFDLTTGVHALSATWAQVRVTELEGSSKLWEYSTGETSTTTRESLAIAGPTTDAASSVLKSSDIYHQRARRNSKRQAV